MSQPKTLAEIFEEEEARLRAIPVDHAAEARASAKAKAEWEKGIRLGWYDEDGNSLLPEEEDEEDGDEDE